MEIIDQLNHYGKNRIPFLFILDFELRFCHCIALSGITSDSILYFVNGFTNSGGAPRCAQASITRHPVSYAEYLSAYRKVMDALNRGDTYLLNLTFPTKIETNATLKDLFFLSTAKYKLWFNDAFVVFSPEPFIRINDRTISSYPMKGTIDAAVHNAEHVLLNDEKEFAEHVTIVDLIRNDLSKVAKDVTVTRFRYVERIKTSQKDLLQVSSEITGRLDAGYNESIGDIIVSMLPAGSVTGAPKTKTVEIINRVENYKRGYYTGIFGYFDGRNLDSGVMIRFIENTGDGYVYKSGGGITVYSDPAKEYRELIDKIYVPVV